MMDEIVLATDKDDKFEQNLVIGETVDTAEISNLLKSDSSNSQAKAPPVDQETEEDDEIKSKAKKITALLGAKKTENDIFA